MMRKFAPCALLLLAVGCAGGSRDAHTPAQVAAEVHPPTEASTVVHTVGAGQTLWSIARRYGVDVAAIVRANGIADPDRIAAGTRLRIPGARAGLPPGKRGHEANLWSWPVRDGAVLSYFGAPRRTHKHQGIDIRGLHGEPVVAAESGKVVYSGSTMRGYGKTIILDHGKGLRTLYAHNSALLVGLGDRVKQGQSIARVGRTGNATTDHCHFEIRLHEVPVNPLDYLSTQLAASEVSR